MYKVFFNQKPLILTSEIKKSTDSNPLIYIKFSSKNQILKAIKSKKTKSVYIYHKNMKKLWKIFTKKFPIKDAELIIEAAQREVKEETGVADLIVIDKIGETYHIFNNRKTYRLKRTYWFRMRSDYKGELMPQEEEGITSVEWISKKRISKILENAYENIKGIVSEVI